MVHKQNLKTNNAMKKYIITILALLASVFTAVAMNDSEASVILGKVAETTKNPAFANAARALKSGGTLSERDQKELRRALEHFGAKNVAVADSIRLVLENKTPAQSFRKTAVKESAKGSSDIDSLAETLGGAVKCTQAEYDRALSTIAQQVRDAGTRYGIQESSSGDPDRKAVDQKTLLASAEAAAAMLEKKPVSGDKFGMSEVLCYSAAKATVDAKALSGPNKKYAERVAKAYQIGAAALRGELTVTDAPSEASKTIPQQTSPSAPPAPPQARPI